MASDFQVLNLTIFRIFSCFTILGSTARCRAAESAGGGARQRADSNFSIDASKAAKSSRPTCRSTISPR